MLTNPDIDARPALRGLQAGEIGSFLERHGFPAFRGKQIHHWLHHKCARSFDEMRNIPKDLRGWLAVETRLGGIDQVVREVPSQDGSVKFLFEWIDGKKTEAVLMPGVSEDHNKMTLCVSSQVGCAVDCKFCVTGANGFFRHMTTDEIVDQALYARHYLMEQNDARLLRNIVFMGMGEPLLNPDNVIHAIRLMIDSDGMNLSPRRITVSTSGILPGIEELARSGTGAKLAISLNATTQADRERIMPITRKYPLDELMEACRTYPRDRNRITFEYVLLAGVNDTRQDARRIVKLVHGIPCKINLIPFNPDPALPFERPADDAVEAFAEILRQAHLTTSVRWSKALDVSGACGQLAGQYRQRTIGGRTVTLPRE